MNLLVRLDSVTSQEVMDLLKEINKDGQNSNNRYPRARNR